MISVQLISSLPEQQGPGFTIHLLFHLRTLRGYGMQASLCNNLKDMFRYTVVKICKDPGKML